MPKKPLVSYSGYCKNCKQTWGGNGHTTRSRCRNAKKSMLAHVHKSGHKVVWKTICNGVETETFRKVPA